jgi:hypothetical protein
MQEKCSKFTQTTLHGIINQPIMVPMAMPLPYLKRISYVRLLQEMSSFECFYYLNRLKRVSSKCLTDNKSSLISNIIRDKKADVKPIKKLKKT